jgi:putative hydrolase of the HAD superfamily
VALGGVTAHRAVLLDALGTLVELVRPWPALACELGARGVEVSEEEARAALLQEMTYYRSHHDEASDRERLADLRERCAVVLREALPPQARVLGDDEMLEALLAALEFRPYPEVRDTLARLRTWPTRPRLVVVSNWDVSLHDVLARTGLAALLDGAVISAEAGVAKPDPAIFARALEVAGGVAPADAVHVGDSLEADVAGARAAGVEAVLVLRDAALPAPPGVRAVRSLAGILDAAAA